MLLLEYNETNKSTGVDLASSGTDSRLAQRFQLKRAAPIGKVSLYLKKTGSPTGYLQASVYSDSSGDPGTVITDGNSNGVPMSSVASSYGWVDFEFDEDSRPELTADTDYHVALVPSSGYSYTDGTTEIIWGADQSTPHYVNGEGETYDGAAWSNISTDTDFCFKLYSKDRSVYSSIKDVESIIKNLTDTGSLTHTSTITATKAMDFEEMVSNEIDAWLSGAGFGTPVTNSSVIDMLKSYALAGTALYCVMSQPTSGFRGERGADTRAGAFKTMYYSLRDDLRDGGEIVDALESLGLTQTASGRPGRGLTAGGIDYDEHEDYEDDIADEEILGTTFKIGMWDND